MKYKFDAIVLGLGAMGSAAIYQLAKRGKAVLGIERFKNLVSRAAGRFRVVLKDARLTNAECRLTDRIDAGRHPRDD